MKKVHTKFAGRILFKMLSPSFLHILTVLLGEGDVRVAAICFEKEPHVILIYINYSYKIHMDKQCQNLY